MPLPKKLPNTLFLLVVWRLMSVFVVQTFHVPDEYWQSLEVAHRLAFGYGYLTWEWRAKIRSYIYPFLVSILYRLLAMARLDSPILLTSLPRAFQALLSGYADYRFYSWTRSKLALFSLCTNWFWYYCASRTLANSFETSLTTIALSIFPWPDGRSQSSAFLWIVGFLTATRPTAAIVWTPLCLYHICSSSRSIADLAKSYALAVICTILYSTVIDSLCYGTFVVTSWEFFRVNALGDVADFYGTQHKLWYLFAGLPAMLGLHTFLFPLASLWAVRNSNSHRRQILMIVVIFWTVAVYSVLPHKEFRFVLPLLPMFIYVCTSSFPFGWRITEFRRKALLAVILLSNLLPGLYLSVVHQRGTLDVMRLLENEVTGSSANETNIMFLTPCHATPMYSHLHVDVPIRFLTCEPNLRRLPDYVDEADQFFGDPMIWLKDNFERRNVPIPDILVTFDNLPTRIEPFLKSYRLLAKLFHAHFPQPNYGQNIMVYRRE